MGRRRGIPLGAVAVGAAARRALDALASRGESGLGGVRTSWAGKSASKGLDRAVALQRRAERMGAEAISRLEGFPRLAAAKLGLVSEGELAKLARRLDALEVRLDGIRTGGRPSLGTAGTEHPAELLESSANGLRPLL